MAPFEAALKGSREIGFTIISITISLVAVFIPVLLMGGVIGRIFNEFAVVVTIAIVASAFVSLTLTPMLCAAPARGARGGTSSRAGAALFERGFDRVAARLRRGLLDVSLRAPAADACWCSSARSSATVWLFRDIPKGFFPQEDIGQLSVTTEARQDISFEAMVELQQRSAEAVFERSPHVAHVASIVGGGRAHQRAQHRPAVRRAKPKGRAPRRCRWSCRPAPRPRPASPASTPSCGRSRTCSFGGRSEQEPVPVRRAGPGPRRALRLGAAAGRRDEPRPRFADVTSDLQINGPAGAARRSTATRPARSGITAEQLRSTLYTGFGTAPDLDHLRHRRQLSR